MNTERVIIKGQSGRIRPEQRAVAMRLLAAGVVSREALAEAFDEDPADVASIMRGLEEEGVAEALREHGNTKKTAWVLADLETKLTAAMRKAKHWTVDGLAAMTGTSATEVRAWLKDSRDKNIAAQVELPGTNRLAWTLVATTPATPAPVQTELTGRFSERETLFLKALQGRPMLVSELAVANGKSLGGTDIKVLERLMQAGMVTYSLNNRGNRVWRLA
jgi:hypothetical protein